MIRVTWAWLGQGHALDLANTVAIERGGARDLLAPAGAFERWAAAERGALELEPSDDAALRGSKSALIALRGPVRDVLAALANRSPLPADAVEALNAASRAAPEWIELDRAAGRVMSRHRGSRRTRLLASFARSALDMVDAGMEVRVCGAPSCGMFYRPSRARQIWCSTQCGTRARVARAYRSRAQVPEQAMGGATRVGPVASRSSSG
jgi:hypothetical protein